VDNPARLIRRWATLPHRGTRRRTGWVRAYRARPGALDDAVQGTRWPEVIGHVGSLT